MAESGAPEIRQIRMHYFNLDREQYVVVRSNVKYLDFRFVMKKIKWSSKDRIICFDNDLIQSSEMPYIWDEQTQDFTDYIKSRFTNATKEPVDFLECYDELIEYMRKHWDSYLQKNHDITFIDDDIVEVIDGSKESKDE